VGYLSSDRENAQSGAQRKLTQWTIKHLGRRLIVPRFASSLLPTRDEWSVAQRKGTKRQMQP
jgi:hypothetical protein